MTSQMYQATSQALHMTSKEEKKLIITNSNIVHQYLVHASSDYYDNSDFMLHSSV